MYALNITIGQPSAAKSASAAPVRRAEEFISAEAEQLRSALDAHLQAGDEAYRQFKAAAEAWKDELSSLWDAYKQALTAAGMSTDDSAFPSIPAGAGDYMEFGYR